LIRDYRLSGEVRLVGGLAISGCDADQAKIRQNFSVLWQTTTTRTTRIENRHQAVWCDLDPFVKDGAQVVSCSGFPWTGAAAAPSPLCKTSLSNCGLAAVDKVRLPRLVGRGEGGAVWRSDQGNNQKRGLIH
jgi:hypothetical protein